MREGNKIESKKFGRFILKILTYTLIIGIINVFRTRLEVPQVFGQSINIYAWIFYVSFNMIIIQLIISVFENLARLGYAESNKIFKALSLKADKWFDFNEKNNETKEIIKSFDKMKITYKHQYANHKFRNRSYSI